MSTSPNSFMEESSDRQNEFRRLYEQYADSVYGYILALVCDEQTAADIYHDVFLDCAKRLPDFTGSFKSYLYTSARNRALTVLKKEARREKLLRQAAPMLLQQRGGELSPEQVVWQQEDRELLSRALAGLKLEQREVLALKIDEHFTFKEIAALLSKPIGTVSWLYREALNQLKRDYEQAVR